MGVYKIHDTDKQLAKPVTSLKIRRHWDQVERSQVVEFYEWKKATNERRDLIIIINFFLFNRFIY